MSAHNLLTLAERYRLAREAYRAEMDKRSGPASLATKEEVAAREAMQDAKLALLEAAESLKPREDGPVMLPDLRLSRGDKLMVEEALARAGSMRLAAHLLDITMRRLTGLIHKHQIVWPRAPEGPTT